MTPSQINKFEGDYSFLSNFYSPVEIMLDGMWYRSTEHAYQAAKTFDIRWRRKIQQESTCGKAKKLGRQVPLREDWEEVKDKIMLSLLRQKFFPRMYLEEEGNALGDMLLETGDAELIEGNWWGDIYWGVCNGVGQNKLGKLLMQVRRELRDSRS